VFAWRAYKRLVEQAGEREERLVAVLDQLDTTVAKNSEVIERNNTALADMREQVRANTDAILRLLDRLDGGEQPA
jgi:hypothetical protein